jgi:hypothetical protein
MSTIYAVSRGCYSDYSVVALFTSVERAEDFMRVFPDFDYNDVATFELDPADPDLIRDGHEFWYVQMLRDGTTEEARELERSPYNYGNLGQIIWLRSQAPAYRGKGVSDCIRSTVLATSQEHAVKITNEHRIRMIESGEWT